MKYSITLAALTGAVLVSAVITPEECGDSCYENWHQCKSQPDAEHCDIKYGRCLGYVPLEQGTIASHPTTCARPVTVTLPTSTDAGLAARAQVTSITPVDPVQCGEDCFENWNQCKSQPDAEHCDIKYGRCLGYVPLEQGTIASHPTTCARPVTVTLPTSTTGAGLAARADVDPTDTSTITPSPTSTETPEECGDVCFNQWLDCKNQPDPNQSFCSAQYSGCINGDPFANGEPDENNHPPCDPSISAPPPTSMTTTATPIPNPTDTPEECALECEKQREGCDTEPGANHSFCGAQFAECLGFVPFQNGTTAIPTACSRSDIGVTPSGTSGANTDIPTDTGAAPTDTGAAPTDTGAAPTDTGAAPTDTGAAPTDTGAAPTDTGAAPTDTGAAPTDTGAAPTDTSTGSAAPAESSGGANSTMPVVVNGAGAAKPAMAMLAIAALALI